MVYGLALYNETTGCIKTFMFSDFDKMKTLLHYHQDNLVKGGEYLDITCYYFVDRAPENWCCRNDGCYVFEIFKNRVMMGGVEYPTIDKAMDQIPH